LCRPLPWRSLRYRAFRYGGEPRRRDKRRRRHLGVPLMLTRATLTATASAALAEAAPSRDPTGGAFLPEAATATAVLRPRARRAATVSAALAEDAPWGDITGQSFLTEDATATAVLRPRADGVLAGTEVFTAAFPLTDAATSVAWEKADGDRFRAGEVLARVQGPARSVLRAERIALNFTQRMCGIASLTAAFVAETSGTGARIVDTRKTTPGL